MLRSHGSHFRFHYPHLWLFIFATLQLFICSKSLIDQTSLSLDLLAQSVNMSVSQTCHDEFECRNQFNATTCLDLGLCTETTTCNGRTDLPVRERPLQSWQKTSLTQACAINNGVPPTFTKMVSFGRNWRSLNVNGSVGVPKVCNARAATSQYEGMTLTFWLNADCNNCSVLELSSKDGSAIHIRVVDGMLCVAYDQCQSNLGKGSWTFVTVKVFQRELTVYENVKKLNFTSPLLQGLDVEMIYIGSTEVASPENEFSLFDVQFYGDVLTYREMNEIHDGLPNTMDGPCRCPPAYPIFSSPVSECQNEAGDSYPKFNTTVHFNPLTSLLNSSTDHKWASAGQGNVTLNLALAQSYDIVSLQVEFASAVPEYVSVSLRFLDEEVGEKTLQCSGTKCEMFLQQTSPPLTVSQYKANVADEISIFLGRTNPTDIQSFIISNISIAGRCDCHGNADTCNVTDGSYVCQCRADTNSAGPNCRSCAPNFFREASDLDCPNSCQCAESGVTDVNSQCEQIGGGCKCKDRVMGTSCDQCKPWTYGLNANNQLGCSLCTCNKNGTAECNNVTGECSCKSNIQSPSCDSCQVNYYGFDSPEGCLACDCSKSGTKEQKLSCDTNTGQCDCKDNVEGLKCDQCKAGFFGLDVAISQGCTPCDCHPVGIDHSTCHSMNGQCPCRQGIITDNKCTPVIESIDPNFGPEVGGTLITIRGKLLGNSTHQAYVFFGTKSQTIISINDTVIIVETSEYDSSQYKSLEMKLSWNKVTKPLVSSSFSYESNPIIDTSKAVDVHSYLRGGCNVEVHGLNLQNVKYPHLNIINKARPNDIAQGGCEHSLDYVTCYTPSVQHLYNSPQDEFHMMVVFDGVTSSNMGKIYITDDPVLKDAGNIRFEYPFEKTISLYGKNLQTACQSNGIEVLTGVIRCDIESISNTHIECRPAGGAPKDGKKLVITVTIGGMSKVVGTLSKVVGTLEYLAFYETTMFIIICCCIAAVILIVVIVIVVFRCRRYRRQQAKAKSKLTENGNASSRQMNTYSEITQFVNTNSHTDNGHSGLILMESVAKEPKKGIINTEAETSLFIDEFLPYVEPGIRDGVKDSFIGSSKFTIGPCSKTGQHAKLMNGTLQRNGIEIQKLTIRSIAKTVSEIVKVSSDSTSGPTLLPWANLALSECLRLRRFQHKHILNCLGIGFDYQRFHLLYSLSKKGSLKDLVADTGKEFSVRELLGFSQQVATGVAYLASKDVTHKDVAARNCMVDANSVIKIGDASFAWDFYPKEYVYNEQRERYLPIRWMAPESLTDGYYDMRTDVWSFGVLVWELLTRGCLPFHEISDDQVTDYVLNGYILGKPETIANNVYELLRNCWSPENESRPSMASLARSLSYILESESDDVYANGYLVTANLAQSVSSPRGVQSGNAQFYSSTDLSHV